MRTLWLVLLLLAAPLAAGELRSVDGREWKRIRKLLPKYLWSPRDRKKIEAAWEKGGYDGVRLGRKQFAELAAILCKGSPYTTEKKRSQTIEVPTGEDDEKLPVRVIVTDIEGPFEVFLADEMLDLDEPFVISVDEEMVWEGRVERSLAFALAHVKETGDRGRVFAASVRVEP